MKDAVAFSPDRKSRDGLSSWCKTCNSAATVAAYHALDPEERKAFNKARVRDRNPEVMARARSRAVEKYRSDPEWKIRVNNQQGANRHGMSVEEYAARVDKPCEVCGKVEPRGKRGCGMHVDHDHGTGMLRGTLCHHCNRGIGSLDDSPVLLRAAALYIEKYRSAPISGA